MRLPYGADSKKFFLSNPVVECVIPWSDVITYYTLQRKINGLPFGKELVIETRRHGKFRLGGYFKQHPDIIQTVPRDAALSH